MTTDYAAVLQWKPLVERLVQPYKGLTALDILAIIQIESGGDPEAQTGPGGATGLMQVMPSEAGLEFSNRPTGVALKDPELNITWGIKILAYYYSKMGSLERALYRYSGGGAWSSYEAYKNKYWWRFERACQDLAAAIVEEQDE